MDGPKHVFNFFVPTIVEHNPAKKYGLWKAFWGLTYQGSANTAKLAENSRIAVLYWVSP